MAKKILALTITVATLLCSLNVSVSAENTIEQQAAVLSSLNVMKGDPDGNLRLYDNVTRAEFTKMAVAISSVRNSVATSLSVSPFGDVPYTHWAAPYVRLAVTTGYVKGYSDATFRPDNNVTYAEAVTIVLKLLGYTDADFGAAWPYGQMGTANSIGLTENISGDINAPITRAGCVILLNNLLDTKMKGSSLKYATVMDCEIKENVVLVATKNESANVAAGKIYTTAGTFKLPQNFNYDNIGARGDLVVRNGDEIVTFIPDGETTAVKTVVYSFTGETMLGYSGGQLVRENIPSSTSVYVGTSPLTFGAAAAKIDAGSVIVMQKDTDGDIEYMNIAEEATLHGPVIFGSEKWNSDYAPGVGGCAVIRDGVLTTPDSLKQDDVVYLVPGQNLLLAYVDSKTGVYKSASPNKDNPITVTVSGITYEIESDEAANALSTAGNIEYGDTVTLLMGKDGKVAYAISAETSKMVVYSTFGNVVVGYKDGQLVQEVIPTDATAYVGGMETTFAAAAAKLSMGTIISVQRDEKGEIDYVSVDDGTSLQGPVIVSGGAWYTDYVSSIEGYTIIRNGSKIASSGIKTNDVAYIAPDLKTMFVYSNTKTGIYEKASPNKDMPSSVTVSGVTYQIEGAAAFNALSSTGDLEYGDTITILLGKDGKVAGAVSAETVSESVNGYVFSTGKKYFVNERGNEYSSYYVDILLPDGEKIQYETSKNYSYYINSVVKMVFNSEGTVVTRGSSSTVSGVVDANAYTIGGTPVNRDVKILEVNDYAIDKTVNYGRVFLKRLDGVTLSPESVLYSAKNSEGEITELIIEDVTGDLYTYSVITKYEKIGKIIVLTPDKPNSNQNGGNSGENTGSGSDNGENTGSGSDNGGNTESGSDKESENEEEIYKIAERVFSYDVNGSTYTFSANLTSITRGSVVKLGFENGNATQPIVVRHLTELNEEVENISLTAMVTKKGGVYKLSDKVGIYVINKGDVGYTWTSINEFVENADSYKIRAYYDKEESKGGRIRIIVAEEI